MKKKKLELIQACVLKPDLLILDEIDSGLDIDSLKIVSSVIRDFKKSKSSIVLITHNIELLKLLEINKAHVICFGSIIKSGGDEIIKQISAKGFAEICSI